MCFLLRLFSLILQLIGLTQMIVSWSLYSIKLFISICSNLIILQIIFIQLLLIIMSLKFRCVWMLNSLTFKLLWRICVASTVLMEIITSLILGWINNLRKISLSAYFLGSSIVKIILCLLLLNWLICRILW